jgi:high-affinity iron transporter
VSILIVLALGFASMHTSVLLSDSNSAAAALNIGVLVFREGLECVLVLAAVAAGAAQTRQSYQRAIAVGAGVGFAATLVTWNIAVRILSDLSKSISALALQAATGLVAVVVLLIVMNWFFHKLYWTGWISFHNKRKRRLLEGTKTEQSSVLGSSGEWVCWASRRWAVCPLVHGRVG